MSSSDIEHDNVAASGARNKNVSRNGHAGHGCDDSDDDDDDNNDDTGRDGRDTGVGHGAGAGADGAAGGEHAPPEPPVVVQENPINARAIAINAAMELDSAPHPWND